MRTSTLCAAIAFSFLMNSSGRTEERAAKEPCAKAQETAEMRDCAGRDYARADGELNRIYGQVMAKLEDAGHQTALKNAQKVWIKYRDANCEYESYLHQGGTVHAVVYADCLTRMTVDKTKELREMLTGMDTH